MARVSVDPSRLRAILPQLTADFCQQGCLADAPVSAESETRAPSSPYAVENVGTSKKAPANGYRRVLVGRELFATEIFNQRFRHNCLQNFGVIICYRLANGRRIYDGYLVSADIPNAFSGIVSQLIPDYDAEKISRLIGFI